MNVLNDSADDVGEVIDCSRLHQCIMQGPASL